MTDGEHAENEGLAAENTVLRNNLLMLKKLMLSSNQNVLHRNLPPAESDDVLDEEETEEIREPPLRRRRLNEDCEYETQNECEKLRIALRSAFLQVKQATDKSESLEKEIADLKEELFSVRRENAKLRHIAEETEIQKRVAAQTVKNCRDFERRNRRKIDNVNESLARIKKLSETNELLMTYLQSVIGVDSVARFMAYFGDKRGGVETAKRMSHVEVLSRTGDLKALCEYEKNSMEDKKQTKETDDEQEEGDNLSSSSSTVELIDQSGDKRIVHDYFKLAKHIIDLLCDEGGANPDDVAGNVVELGIPRVNMCQALCLWISTWTVENERLLNELNLAYRSPNAQSFQTPDERVAVQFLRSLHQRGGEYLNVAEDLCMMITVQILNDIEQGFSQKNSISQALAHALALIARELNLGTSPVYTFVSEVLIRCSESLRSVVLRIIEAAIVAWPQAFVPVGNDFFIHSLCYLLRLFSPQSNDLLDRIVSTCHWHIATQEQLARCLVHSKTLKKFAQLFIRDSDSDEAFRVAVIDQTAMNCWFCSISILVSNNLEFIPVLKRFSSINGRAVRLFISSVLTVFNRS